MKNHLKKTRGESLKGEETMNRRIKSLSVFLALILVFSLVLSSFAFAAAPEINIPEAHNPAGFAGIDNARDLGGYPAADGKEIKADVLFRSGNLSEATAEYVAKIQEIGITKIIDLRTSFERLRKPNVKIDGVEQVPLSMLTIPNLLVLQREDWMSLLGAIRSGIMETWDANLYRQYIQDPNAIKATKQFFQEVEENATAENGPAPILWHCTAGKDRTGIEAILLMGALGCSDDDIYSEYMNTNAFYAQKAQDSYDKAYKLTHSNLIATEFFKYEIVQENWFDISMEVIRRTGNKTGNATIEEYLRNVIGLKDDDFKILREAYLE